VEYSEIIKMREAAEFKELEKQINEKYEEATKLFKQLDSKFPIGPNRAWCLMGSGEIHSQFILTDEDYEL
jgi:hypothetical protein